MYKILAIWFISLFQIVIKISTRVKYIIWFWKLKTDILMDLKGISDKMITVLKDAVWLACFLYNFYTNVSDGANGFVRFIFVVRIVKIESCWADFFPILSLCYDYLNDVHFVRPQSYFSVVDRSQPKVRSFRDYTLL